MPPSVLRKELAATALRTLLALFLIPGLTLGLAHHFRLDADEQLRGAFLADVASAPSLDEAQRAALTQRLTESPPSLAACTADPDDPLMSSLRETICPAVSPLWQFVLVEKLALWTVLGGVGLLLLMAGLGALAFSRRAVSYASFVFGWRVLVLAGALELLLQGAFAVWLSYWVTAFFFEIYILKIILLVGLAAAVAVGTAVIAMFSRAQIGDAVHGELIEPEAAPALWARIRDLAARVDTAPPQHVIGGVDANFFVTEQSLQAGERRTSGRTLFISIPLLRVLAQEEADAVLAHELGHFVGGDTAAGAKLGPKLVAFDQYTEQMRTGGATLLAYFLLIQYRLIFELALQKSSREREFAADLVAAKLTSAESLARALVKVAAYASYRGDVEQQLFDQRQRHADRLDIGQRVAGGLSAFSQSEAFSKAMHAGSVPHPFDSHPPLHERIRNVGHEMSEAAYAAVVCEPPAACWTDAIADADAIEQRLWGEFEQQFAQEHEFTLAYRYEPANEEEREIVLRHFPDVHFHLNDGGRFSVTYAGLMLPEDSEFTVVWDRVKDIEYEDALAGADRLTIKHPKGSGASSTKSKIAIPSGQRDRLKETMGRYWQRHQAMRELAKSEGRAADATSV